MNPSTEAVIKTVENLVWNDIFPLDIIHYTLIFVFFIGMCHVHSIFFKSQVSKMYTHLFKAITYSLVILLLGYYFLEHDMNINIFTGFTFLFSSIEIVDNVMLAIKEFLGTNLIFRNESDNKKRHNAEEEKYFQCIFILKNLKLSLAPGRVNKYTKKYVEQFMELHNNNFFEFYSLEKIISNGSDYPISNSFYVILTSEMFRKISSNIANISDKHPSHLLSFNKQECDTFSECIQLAIDLSEVYIRNKNNIINIIETIEILK